MKICLEFCSAVVSHSIRLYFFFIVVGLEIITALLILFFSFRFWHFVFVVVTCFCLIISWFELLMNSIFRVKYFKQLSCSKWFWKVIDMQVCASSIESKYTPRKWKMKDVLCMSSSQSENVYDACRSSVTF